MRVKEIYIERWRNLRDVRIVPLDDATLVCLVGENGTGKSGILELVGDALGRIGVGVWTAARQAPRSINLADLDATVVIDVRPWDMDLFKSALLTDKRWRHLILRDSEPPWDPPELRAWDRTFTVSYRRDDRPTVEPDGVPESSPFGLLRRYWMNASEHFEGPEWELNKPWHLNKPSCLSLGPDRVYAATRIPRAQGINAPVPDEQLTWERTASRWMSEVVAPYRDEQEAWDRETIRRTRAGDWSPRQIPDPPVGDPFPGFSELLPHLGIPYAGAFPVDGEDANDVVFRGRVGDVAFTDLSSGEKDVLITTLFFERFRLAPKVLLIDEPELHLHPDLSDRRLEHLKKYNADGQTWIATHSYGAIEVAGEANTFVLSRLEDGLVSDAKAWNKEGAARLLAAALGWPTVPARFTQFVFTEGDPSPDKRGQIERIVGNEDLHVLPAGGRGEVIRRLKEVLETARSVSMLRSWRVGAIVDGDFLDALQRAALMVEVPQIHVLGCHDEENLFLEPSAVAALLQQKDPPERDAVGVIQAASDLSAGYWIFGCAAHRTETRAPLKKSGGSLRVDWKTIEDDRDTWLESMLGEQPESAREAMRPEVQRAIEEYSALRNEPSRLWRDCQGSRVLPNVATKVKRAPKDYIATVAWLWEEGHVARPEPLDDLRSWIEQLQAVRA